MWMMVMFDLPVTTPESRRTASAFRKDLLDMGFQMVQYSVYIRFCAAGNHIETLSKAVGRMVPSAGKVSVLTFTDKQYGRITNYNGGHRGPRNRAPAQLELL